MWKGFVAFWEKAEKIATVATACFMLVTVIIAYCAVKQQTAVWEEEKKLGRPYISFPEGNTPTIERTGGSEYNIWFAFENIGKRPASQFYFCIYALDENCETKPLTGGNFYYANEIPPGGAYPAWHAENVKRTKEPRYIVAIFRYKDLFTSDYYSQSYYLKWNGVDAKLKHTTKDEQQNVDECLQQNDIQ